MKKNRVLLPVDGSDFARQIFPHVIRYLPADENELILMQVRPPQAGHVGRPGKPATPDCDVITFERRADYVESAHPIYASQEWESAVADIQYSLEKDVHLLEMAGYTVTSVIRMDKSPGTAILNYIETHDVDLVAMTTHGRTGLGRMLFGSVAHYLAQHLQIPMMVVRPMLDV